VVVRVVDPSATLWSMLIEGMARVTRPCGRQVGKHAVSEQSDCSTPCFGVEGFKHGGGSGELQDVNRSRTVEVTVGAVQPSCRRSLPPEQSRTGNDVFQIDQQRCCGRSGPLLAGHPSRGLRPIHPYHRGQLRSADHLGQIPYAGGRQRIIGAHSGLLPRGLSCCDRHATMLPNIFVGRKTRVSSDADGGCDPVP